MEIDFDSPEHLLGVFTENELYNKIVAIRDGKFSDEEERIKKVIQEFEETLPPYLKEVKNIHDLIMRKIEETDRNIQRNKARRAEREER